jgi:hypothetical protein
MDNFLKQHSSSRDVANYTLKFGKHKDKTFEQVYSEDKAYVAWLLQTLEQEKNGKMLDYFRQRVEQDYTGEPEPVKRKKKEKC